MAQRFYISGGKVAGILLETTQHAPCCVVVGIGMNINQAPTLPPTDRALQPTSIASAIGRPVSRFDVLESVVRHIHDILPELDHSHLTVINDFRKRCLLSGKQVQFQSTSTQQGNCVGITDAGLLQIDTPHGPQFCQTGEVSLVRIQP